MLREKGYSLRAIARALGRSASTISDERTPEGKRQAYDPATAHHKATVRRKQSKYQGMAIVANRALEDFISTALREGQSPGAVAGRLATGRDGLPSVSRDTIERFIRSVYGRQLEYDLAVLKRQARRKRRRPMALPPPGDDRHLKTFIDTRPPEATKRDRLGDLEVDFIVSGKSGTGYLLTVVDRKSRYGFIRRVLPVTIGNAVAALQDVVRCFEGLGGRDEGGVSGGVGAKGGAKERQTVHSLTLDNDILWRYHQQLEKAVGVPIYFCHPYSSWEKGSIENFNKHIRKYVRKGSDISTLSLERIQWIEGRLNRRYLQVLDYQTPEEYMVSTDP